MLPAGQQFGGISVQVSRPAQGFGAPGASSRHSPIARNDAEVASASREPVSSGEGQPAGVAAQSLPLAAEPRVSLLTSPEVSTVIDCTTRPA